MACFYVAMFGYVALWMCGGMVAWWVGCLVAWWLGPHPTRSTAERVGGFVPWEIAFRGAYVTFLGVGDVSR